MNVPEEKTSENKNYFQKLPIHLRAYCDGKKRYGHTTKNKNKSTEDMFHHKRISFGYYINTYSDHISPSGCYHYFGDDCKKKFVKDTLEIENEKYKFLNQSNVELKMGRRAGKILKIAKKRGLCLEN